MIRIICGNELYLIQTKLSEILKEYSEEDIITYDGSLKEFNILNVIDECNFPNLFSDKKIVLVKNPLFLSSKQTLDDSQSKQLINYAKNPSDNELIFYGDIEIDKRKKINKELQNLAQYIICNKLNYQEFANHIKSSIKTNKINISSAAINYLIDNLPNDLANFHHELTKLILYGDYIDIEDVKKLIDIPLDNDVFNLTNAIIEKNINKAFKKWEDLKKLKQEPIGIALIIANQFRFMYQVRYLMDLGYNEDEIARHLKAHPYRVSLTCKNVWSIKRHQLLKILAKLAKLDQGFKNGTIDRNIGLDKFMIEIMR